MPKIPDSEIDRVKKSADLLALVRSRGIEMKKHGSKDYVGKCPFHDDHGTPNFVVSPAKGLFHCMACGAAGNPIQFVQRFDGVSFRHAFELLSNGAAFENAPTRTLSKRMHRSLESPIDPEASDSEVMEQVIDYYHDRLLAPESTKAREMLEKRGLWDEELVRRFKIGYGDRTLGLRLPHKQRQDGAALRKRLVDLGLYRQSGHEHFNGSIVVPICNEAGEVKEIYGRKVTKNLRKGIPDHLYLAGKHAGIWNASALKDRDVILCEAPLDALTFYLHGFHNVTFIFGTQGFTDELLEALIAHKVEIVRLAYDADSAGERAAQRDAQMLMDKGIEVYRVRFPEGQDANDYGKGGAEKLRDALNAAQWLGKAQKSELASPMSISKPEPSSLVAPEVLSNKLAARSDEVGSFSCLGGEAKKESPLLEAVREGEFWMLTVGDRLYRVSGLERNAGFESLKITLRVWFDDLFHLDNLDLCLDAHRRRFIERASVETTLDPLLLKKDLAKVLMALESLQESRLKEENQAEESAVEMSAQDRAEAEEFLLDPKLIERVDRDFEMCGMVGESSNRLVGYLACTSRLLRRPLAVIIQSTSAAGKSTLMEAILAMFPEEERIKYSAMTGQSLYYLGETNLKHKMLAIVEEEGAERASYALKLLQSEGELTIASTGKNPKSGQMETQTYHVEGPVMIFLTTTAIDIDEELQNRCLTLSVDESAEQTKRIHDIQRAARTLEGLERSDKKEKIVNLHRNAQRLLDGFAVWNPYVEQLTFTSGRTRTRRDHEKYLSLIDAVTLLHQKQREKVTLSSGKEALTTTIEDIKIANRLAPEVLGRSLDELPPQTRKLWDAIKKIALESEEDWKRYQFTRRELREFVGWSVTQVRVHLERLHELEYIMPKHGRNGVRFEYQLKIDPRTSEDLAHVGLIDPENLQKSVTTTAS